MSLSLRGKKFNNEILGISITCYKDENNMLWFVGKEVGKILGYSKPKNAISRHVKFNQKRELGTGVSTPGTEFRGPETGPLQSHTLMIDETGFWNLVCRSQLPAADDFREWICGKVLPAIRKQGYYALPGVLEAIKSIEDKEICKLQGKEKKIFRRTSKYKSALTKNEIFSESGHRGGIATQNRWRSLKTTTEKLEVENKNLKEQVDKLTDQNTDLKEQVDELTQEVEELTNELGEVKFQLEEILEDVC